MRRGRKAGSWASLFAAVFTTLSLGASGAPASADPDGWKLDAVRLKNGRTIRGLLVEETPAGLRFRYVVQRPGARTVVFPPTTIARAEVERVERLDPSDRQTLLARLKALESAGRDEADLLAALELRPVPWGKDGKGEGLEYQADQFLLRSNARADIVRRVALRLEQVYAAYTRFLPPRKPAAEPTTIVLVRSLQEYHEMLRGRGRDLRNPAVYDPAQNQVVCASDLEQLGEQLEQVRQKHRKILDRLDEEEAELKKQFKDKVPAHLQQPITTTRKQIAEADRQNEARFERATRRLFQTLAHEAFHAYLANFVYPPAEAEVPRWLNEGLAQIFETALIEAGELRVGHADAERLKRAKAAAAAGTAVPLAELLRAGPRDFLVAHASDQAVSDRFYLASWALAFYLTFERRLLGTPALDQYVTTLKRGGDALEAFRALVGQPLPEFEHAFRRYVRRLRSDGTTDSPATTK
jgi:hypothetical protein